MALSNNLPPGVNNVPSYQMSGVPFVVSGSATSGTVTQVTFPYVTRDIYIRSRSTSCIFGFSSLGVSTKTNSFSLASAEWVNLSVRTNAIFVSTIDIATGSYQIVAGLTGIPGEHFPTLSASNGFSGIG